jgi:nucleoid-associated protein YgaU
VRDEESISPYERHGEPSPAEDAQIIVHIFNASETISGLAHRYYGDWRLWRLIADRNSIKDVRRIEPGTQLLIPPKPVERGRYESI